MTGEENFLNELNNDWINGIIHIKDCNCSETYIFTHLLMYAAGNIFCITKPVFIEDKSLKEKIDSARVLFGWNRSDVQMAYNLACKKIIDLAIRRGHLIPH